MKKKNTYKLKKKTVLFKGLLFSTATSTDCTSFKCAADLGIPAHSRSGHTVGVTSLMLSVSRRWHCSNRILPWTKKKKKEKPRQRALCIVQSDSHALYTATALHARPSAGCNHSRRWHRALHPVVLCRRQPKREETLKCSWQMTPNYAAVNKVP